MEAASSPRGRIVLGDNLDVLRALPDGLARLVYVDPPFNTGGEQRRTRLRTVRDDDGDRTGFKGARYRTEVLGSSAWRDAYDDYLGFLAPRLAEARRVLAADGSLFFHIDSREVALLQGAARRDLRARLLRERDRLGLRLRRASAAAAGRPSTTPSSGTRRTPGATSSTTTRSTASRTWRRDSWGREKAARGKTPTDVWWHTIVSPTGREKTGYPTQKPLRVVERIVRVHSQPGDLRARLLRRQRDDRRGGGAAWATVRSGRQQPRGGPRHGTPPGLGCSRARRLRGARALVTRVTSRKAPWDAPERDEAGPKGRPRRVWESLRMVSRRGRSRRSGTTRRRSRSRRTAPGR